jgi:amidophosphoribosyltransferase
VNAKKLRSELSGIFGKFRTDADTEVLAKSLLAGLERFRWDYEKAVASVLDTVEGAYSAMVLDSDGQFHAFRDIWGVRPFCFGKAKDIIAFASETPALEINGIDSFEYVHPGEMVSILNGTKLQRKRLRKKGTDALCSFEFAYFSRPDSILNGTERPVYKIREALAASLAREYSSKLEKDDLIVSMPETADDAAYGLHEVTKLPWERAVRKNRYVTRRAFISTKGGREEVIEKKMNVVTSLVKGKRVAVVEDSIVRGDTSRINVAKLRRKGAKRVDLYVTFPRITNPCFYGVDMSTFGELIGAKMGQDEIAKWMGADSVNYQTVDGLVDAIGLPKNRLCLACVTGGYPSPIADQLARKRKGSEEPETGNRIYEDE